MAGMKAVRFHAHGGPEVLRYEDVPDPKAGPGEIVLRVRAASVNHLDIWMRKGLPGIKIPLPRVPGADAAGEIVEVGAGVTDRKVGERVLLDPGKCCRECEFCLGGEGSLCAKYSILGEHENGCYSEHVAVPAWNAIPIPDGLPFETAAAAPLVFLTAWRMLMTRARVRPGEEILIHGAGAGVGTAALQIAKRAGARVIVTCGTDEKCEKAKALGADTAINYEREEFVGAVRRLTGKRGVDVVVDYVGKKTWGGSLQVLRRGGRLVTCGATTGYDPVEDIRHIFFRQLEVIGSTMGSRKELLDVLRLVFAGVLKPVIDAVLPLSQAVEAHRRIESRQVFGKLILLPQ